MAIVGTKVKLRAIERTDLQKIHLWSNDSDIQHWLTGWHFPSSMIVMERWAQEISVDGSNIRFAVTNNEGLLIGTAVLENLNWKDRNASVGLMIGEKKSLSRGCGSDVVRQLMKISFEELGLKRLNATVIEYNSRSLHVFVENCGWLKEGEREAAYYRKNQFWCEIFLGITKERYVSLVDSGALLQTESD